MLSDAVCSVWESNSSSEAKRRRFLARPTTHDHLPFTKLPFRVILDIQREYFKLDVPLHLLSPSMHPPPDSTDTVVFCQRDYVGRFALDRLRTPFILFKRNGAGVLQEWDPIARKYGEETFLDHYTNADGTRFCHSTARAFPDDQQMAGVTKMVNLKGPFRFVFNILFFRAGSLDIPEEYLVCPCCLTPMRLDSYTGEPTHGKSVVLHGHLPLSEGDSGQCETCPDGEPREMLLLFACAPCNRKYGETLKLKGQYALVMRDVEGQKCFCGRRDEMGLD